WRGGVAAILGLPRSDLELETWLAVVAAAELIRPHGSSRLANEQEYAFHHALTRDAAYSLLSAGDVRTGHRRAGEFLATAGEPDHAIIAEHMERGGEKQRAAELYLRAGEGSLEGTRHLTTGLALLASLPETSARAQLELKLRLALG